MHPLDPPPKFVETLYVLDRIIFGSHGEVSNAQFMGVLTARDKVVSRISAAHHYGGVENGMYRVMELIPDENGITHAYQVKVLGGKQSWLRLAKNDSFVGDRVKHEEIKLLVDDDSVIKEIDKQIADTHRANRRVRIMSAVLIVVIIYTILERLILGI